jgi:integrase
MKTENRQHLTATLIKTIACPAPRDGGKLARTFLYDDEVPGLAFCASSTGKRFFCLCRTIGTGEFKRLTLGDVTMGVEKARKLAVVKNGEIAAGVDPVAEKRAKREAHKAAKEAAKNAPTFGNLWTAYRTEYLEKEAKPRTVREYTRIYDAHLAKWADRLLSEVTTRDCETLKATVGERGHYMANRVLELVSAMYRRFGRRFGLEKGWTPTADVEYYDEKSRTRVLTDEELADVFAAIDADENKTAADFFRMVIYTGVRKSNVIHMEWNDISEVGGRRVWKLRGEVMKNGAELTVTLLPDAVEIIDRRAESNPPGSKYVFPANRPTQEQIDRVRELRAKGEKTRAIGEATSLSQSSIMRIINPAYAAKPDGPFLGSAKAWKRILKRAGVPHATIHDLRRTYVTNMIEAGVPLAVVAAIVGHKTTATTERSYIAIRAKTAAQAALTGGAKVMENVKAAMEAQKAKRAKAG